VTFIVEGNEKHKKLTLDCQAVSEVMGTVLMISIIVLALSAVAITVFSEGGEMDPVHTPHTNLQEKLDRSKNIVRIFHSGGEDIDLKDIKIILNVDGQQVEFNNSDYGVTLLDPEGKNSSDNVFKLRDCIVIDTSSKVDITDAAAIDLYFVHTESSQVIQKTMLWRDFGDLPEWITPYPYGSVYDSYAGQFLDTELVDEVGDGLFTENDFPKDEYIYENFTFGNLDDLYIPEDTLFSKVILKIVYRIHDESAKLEMEINNGSPAVIFELPKKGNESLNNSDFVELKQDITPYLKNATDLENLVVKISTTPNAAEPADKEGWVDFIGIHLEY
jgi:FlaG/FlaF family flagellin (archaellin)